MMVFAVASGVRTMPLNQYWTATPRPMRRASLYFAREPERNQRRLSGVLAFIALVSCLVDVRRLIRLDVLEAIKDTAANL
jgi:hypothetical protein